MYNRSNTIVEMATFPSFRKLSAVLLGLTIGLTFVTIFVVTFTTDQHGLRFVSSIVNTVNSRAVHPREVQKLSNDLHEDVQKSFGQYLSGNVKFEDLHLHKDDDAISKALYQKERVLCWIMTSPKNLDVKARVVRDTWSRRCNKVLFMSSVTDPKFPTIGLNVSEGRRHLTAKTMQAFRYIYENHFDDADWFMKADDDTYVILENLRYFLTSQNKSEPVFFGHHFKVYVKQGYYSGGGGYVLSKEALRRYGEKGRDPSICRQDFGAEDIEMGKCMQNLGVRTVNTLDALGRSRFHCFDPQKHLIGDYPKWYYKFDANGAKKGAENISDYAISFHYVSPQKMHALEFYIYHLRPYGIVSGTQDLSRQVEVKPGTQEVNKQADVKPGTQGVNRQEDVKPGTQEVNRQEDVKPGTQEVNKQTDVKPGTQGVNRQEDVKPGTQEVNRQADVKPRTQELNRQADVKPGTQEVNRQEDVKPGTQEVNRQADVTPGTQELNRQANVKPGTQEVNRQADVKPGTQEVNSQANVKPGTQEVNRQEDVKPGTQEVNRQADVTPRPQEVNRQADVKPGTQEVNRQANVKPGTQEVNRQANVKPRTQELNRQANVKPGTQEVNRQANVKPGTQEVNRQVDVKPGTQEVNRQADVTPRPQEVNRQADVKPGTQEVNRQVDVKPGTQELNRQANVTPGTQEVNRHA